MGRAARAELERLALQLWYGKADSPNQRLALKLLAPLSWLTGVVARRRRRLLLTGSHQPPVPVIVVGNLVAGGAGKTPVTIAIAREMTRRGRRVGLLASGYGARSRGPHRVSPDSAADQVGDEAVLLARETGLPVVAGRRRDLALSMLLTNHPDLDLVISDDGLQHRWLPRTIELVVFDRRGAGNGRLLPAGPLREPLSATLGMDAVLLNGDVFAPVSHPRRFHFEVQAGRFRQLAGERAIATPDELANLIGGEPALAIAGIAQPSRFFEPLRALGLTLRTVEPGDHAAAPTGLLAGATESWILMTDKDAVKLGGLADDRCWALSVQARFEPAFFDWLTERLSGPKTA